MILNVEADLLSYQLLIGKRNLLLALVGFLHEVFRKEKKKIFGGMTGLICDKNASSST